MGSKLNKLLNETKKAVEQCVGSGTDVPFTHEFLREKLSKLQEALMPLFSVQYYLTEVQVMQSREALEQLLLDELLPSLKEAVKETTGIKKSSLESAP